ncbi:hypothetical protein FOA52_003801 [Chlamydomonas sp. UWO 241]|nr:hypothetical protein FOA52_003801 [Chlamydomonas sp. UWO 241]
MSLAMSLTPQLSKGPLVPHNAWEWVEAYDEKVDIWQVRAHSVMAMVVVLLVLLLVLLVFLLLLLLLLLPLPHNAWEWVEAYDEKVDIWQEWVEIYDEKVDIYGRCVRALTVFLGAAVLLVLLVLLLLLLLHNVREWVETYNEKADTLQLWKSR